MCKGFRSEQTKGEKSVWGAEKRLMELLPASWKPWLRRTKGDKITRGKTCAVGSLSEAHSVLLEKKKKTVIYR